MININVDIRPIEQRFSAMIVSSQNLAPTMRRIGKQVVDSNKRNFALGGRPFPWVPNKVGTRTLFGTGRLMNSIQVDEVDKEGVTVTAGEGLRYAKIHQLGGTINHPGSTKLQVFKSGGKTIFSRGTKAHTIPIPQRRFFRLQDEDVDVIKTMLTGALLNEKSPITIT